MADNVVANPGAGGDTLAFDDVSGVKFARSKMTLGADGVDGGDVSAANPMPVTGSVAEDSAAGAGFLGLPVLAVRQDADGITPADGDFAPLQLNAVGRLKVSAQPGLIPLQTATITANSQSRSIDCSRASNLMLHCYGTFSTINCAFEGSLNATDDTNGNWFAVQAIRTNANTIETTTGNLSAAPAYGWELSINGLARLRVRSTAFTSGTQNWLFQLAPYATEPIPGAQISGTQPISGSITVAAGTAAIGDVGQQYRANATGSGTVTNLNCPATPAVQTIKGSAGRLIGLYLVNTNATVRYLKVFNIVSPTLGSSTAALRIPLPQNQPVYIAFEGGMAFGTAITCAICSTASLTDATGAVTLDDVTGFSVHA